MGKQLSREAWLVQGQRALASEGPNALRVVQLASKLGVTRGSFYWHFRDIEDFCSQLLEEWRQRSTDEIIRDLDTEAEPVRLKLLFRRAFKAQDTLERAMRAWALDNIAVKQAVAEVDKERVSYVCRLLKSAGLSERKAQSRASFIYFAYLGHTLILDTVLSEITDTALDDLADLFRG